MKEKIKTFLAVCVLVVAAPYIVTLLFQGQQTSGDLKKEETLTQEPLPFLIESDGQEMDVEEYLAGIVAEEISLEYEPEAIKAQAVIARTSLIGALQSKEEPPRSMSREEMLTLWGQDGFEKNYQVLEKALLDTKGEILVFEEAPIHAAYHAVSAGKTRNAREALGTRQPYLSSVESAMDIPANDFLKVVFLEKEEMAEKLNEACKEDELTKEGLMGQLAVTKRDSSDYVLEVTAGSKTMTGEEFRACFQLNSACFYWKEVEGKVRIVTKGLGHGLGLSQYGANELAKEGSNYKEILQYYYKNAEIEEQDGKSFSRAN